MEICRLNTKTNVSAIGGLEIPCAMIDTGSDSSIFSDNMAELVEELLGIKINRKKIHALNGVAISIGTMDNVPITIGSGENTATITDEFSVVPVEKDRNGNAKSLVILGTQWQYRAGWEPLIKGELRPYVMERLSPFPYQFTNPSVMFLI